MGSSQSTQRQQQRQQRNQRRPSNRLSKPPRSGSSSSLIKSNTYSPEANQRSPVARGSAEWRDPWNRNSAPDISMDPQSEERRERRVHSFPSYSVTSLEAPRTPVGGNRSWSHIGDSGGGPSRQLSRSSSRASNFSIRRSSLVQLSEPSSRSRLPLVREQPKRINSYHFEPQEIENAIQESPVEEARYHNHYCSADSQRFSLIRRKSLLTPGLATRTPDNIYRHHSSSIEPLNASSCSVEASRTSQWPLYEPDSLFLESPPRTAPPMGASSPNDHEYAHLGGLRFGSLRVVNGAASPSSSDRSYRHVASHATADAKREDERLRESSRSREDYRRGDIRFPRFDQSQDDLSKSPPGGMSWAELKSRVAMSPNPRKSDCTDALDRQAVSGPQSTLRQAWKKRSTSMLEIPSLPREGKGPETDVPDSPFSFEKSPTLPAIPRHSALFLGHVEDEGINLSDSDVHSSEAGRSRVDVSGLEDAAMQDSISRLGRRASRPLNKVDSGYSSTTSIWSMPDHRKRDSFSSQISQQYPHWRSSGLGVDILKDQDTRGKVDGTKESRRKSNPDIGEFQAETSVRRRSRLRKARKEDSHSRTRDATEQDQAIATTTMCREGRSRSLSRFRAARKSYSTPRPSSREKTSPPRFYADLTPISVPPVPPDVAARHKARGRQEGSPEDVSWRKRRFSTSQIKNGIKSLLLESKTGESKSERPSDDRARSDSQSMHNVSRTSQSVEPRSRNRAKSDPHLGARSTSESRIPRPSTRNVLQASSEKRGSSERGTSRSSARQRSPRVEEEVPPMPSLPTMDELWKKEKRRSTLLPSVSSLEEMWKKEEHRRSDLSLLHDGRKKGQIVSNSLQSKEVRRPDQRKTRSTPMDDQRKREGTRPDSIPSEAPNSEKRKSAIPQLDEIRKAHRRSDGDPPSDLQRKERRRSDYFQHEAPRGRTRSRSMVRHIKPQPNPQPNPQRQSGHYVTSLRSPPPELFEEQESRLTSPRSVRSSVSGVGSDGFVNRNPRLTSPRSVRSSVSGVGSDGFVDRNPKLTSPRSPRSSVSGSGSDFIDRYPRLASPKSIRSSGSSEGFADKHARMTSPRSVRSGASGSGSDFIDRYPRLTSPKSTRSIASVVSESNEKRYSRFSFESGKSR